MKTSSCSLRLSALLCVDQICRWCKKEITHLKWLHKASKTGDNDLALSRSVLMLELMAKKMRHKRAQCWPLLTYAVIKLLRPKARHVPYDYWPLEDGKDMPQPDLCYCVITENALAAALLARMVHMPTGMFTPEARCVLFALNNSATSHLLPQQDIVHLIFKLQVE